jgi:ribonuclease T1
MLVGLLNQEKVLFMFCNWDGSSAKKSVKSVFMAGLLAFGLMLAGTGLVHINGPVPGTVGDTIALAQLPVQGQDMMKLIYVGGPFKYDKDGTVFGNRERILPAKTRVFYREYTVKTPGERTRGARRIVCGGLKPTAPDACYYTDDHYASFRKIAQ